MYNKKGYKIRARTIQETAKKHFEPGNQAKCWRQVHKKHIQPVFGICYDTFLKYLKVDVSDVEAGNVQEDKRQMKLFND